MRNKDKAEVRQIYERAVSLACDACKQEIENAHRVFLIAKKEARKGRDKAIAVAKKFYSEETN